MPVHPETPSHPARSTDADPLLYLRGVVACFLGAGTIVALGLGLSGIAPKALTLALVLWALFGILTGMIDYVLGPAAELVGRVFASAGSLPPGPPDRLAPELKALQRTADRLDPASDMRADHFARGAP